MKSRGHCRRRGRGRDCTAGRSLPWLWLHGFVGWALCALTMATLLWATSLAAALAIHALAVPVIFAVVARHYFLARGARDPLATAFTFVGIVGMLDFIVVAGLVQHSLALFGSVVGVWAPLVLIFFVTWATGELLSTLPWKSRSSTGAEPDRLTPDVRARDSKPSRRSADLLRRARRGWPVPWRRRDSRRGRHEQRSSSSGRLAGQRRLSRRGAKPLPLGHDADVHSPDHARCPRATWPIVRRDRRGAHMACA